MDIQTSSILIIEDDHGLRSQLGWHLDQYKIYTAGTREEALAIVSKHAPPIVLQDLGLPPDADSVSEGMRCISEILNLNPNCKILVMTGRGEEENALKAISLGAHDFFPKPINTDTLDLIIERCIKIYQLEEQNRLKQTNADAFLSGIITADCKMLEICRLIKKIGPTEISCTLLGESGVGKEVLARSIHATSQRSDKKFLAINCASIPENLIESELFGYEKGAFSGAMKLTKGKIESTNQGTLFLDEIGDMPLNLQAKLLRFLQQRTIQRVGGTQDIDVDVRVVCATNKNLKEMVGEGTFREDLYYRICELEITIPPLRDRNNDKTLLAKHFLEHHIEANQLKLKGFSQDALSAIQAYEWPGNVREMENRIKTAAIICDNLYVTAADLSLSDKVEISEQHETTQALKDVRKHAEIGAIEQALSTTNNISAAAKVLKVSRPTLYDMMKKYGIKHS
ncbi:PEP-CTERM-box response regulator transcription factor [Bacterioplanoides sp.]|uniref:PEP-CTERM-box response regulator transcription factor n=1 Tax=Bacterioplanoides sp. TaxID=2066072 RepID=UPI003B008E72